MLLHSAPACHQGNAECPVSSLNVAPLKILTLPRFEVRRLLLPRWHPSPSAKPDLPECRFSHCGTQQVGIVSGKYQLSIVGIRNRICKTVEQSSGPARMQTGLKLIAKHDSSGVK